MIWLRGINKRFICVVMDAKTGEILAFSQRPTLILRQVKISGEKWANDLYQNTYEPGSTFKSFGLAATIQEGKFNPKKNMSLDIVISWVLEFPTGIKLVGAKFQCHWALLILQIH